MSGGFLTGRVTLRRLGSSEAVSSLLSSSELDETIHFADSRVPSCGVGDPCGRGRGEEELAIGDPLRGIGDDRPMACGGNNLAGRDGVPFGVAPPPSFPLRFPPPLTAVVEPPADSVLTKLFARAKLGLTGRARLTWSGTFPGGIESDGCSGTGKCTELRFLADSI